MPDLLLTHGHFLYEDAKEVEIMKPYPPLGLLYVNSHLKAHGVDAHLFDTTFSRFDELHVYLQREKPPVVGIYSNLMTRANVLRVNHTLVAAAAFPRTNTRLREAGFAVRTIEADELAKAEGALTCCSILVLPFRA